MATTFSNTTILAPTSSLVREVLDIAGKQEKDDLDAKLGKLYKRTEEVKVKVYNDLQEKYVDFYPNLNTAEDLARKVRATLEEMQQMAERVDNEVRTQLNVTTTEFEDLSTQLTETSIIVTVLDKLAQINSHLETVSKSVAADEYTTAVHSLIIVRQLLDTDVIAQEKQIHILDALRQSFSVQEEKLRGNIRDAWRELVRWTIPKEDDSNDSIKSRSGKVVLQIGTQHRQRDALADVVQALSDMGGLTATMKIFGQQVLQHFVGPVLDDPGACLQLHAETRTLTMDRKSSTNHPQAVPPKTALQSVCDILHHLNDDLLGLTVTVAVAGNETKSKRLMTVLGECISDELQDMVIKRCLVHAVPSTNRELANYQSNVVIQTETMQNTLTELHFLDKNTSVLTDFVSKVDILFANKKTQEILEKGQHLMTSDIHIMVQINANLASGDLPQLNLEGASAKKARQGEHLSRADGVELSPNTFMMPTCYISQWTQELMQLAYETLHEAESSSPQCVPQLFLSVRKIFELVCSVVPTYHKEALATLPQITALHHNNCMYLAHHLLTLGHQFRPQLPGELGPGLATFVDFVPILRRLGTECLLQQVARQRDQLMDCLSSVQGFVNMSEDGNFHRGQQAVKQTLHQLQHLSRVWQEVLPHGVYCKIIGTLLNSAIQEVVTCIISLEDISADDADCLSHLLSIFTGKGPALFELQVKDGEMVSTNPSTLIHRHVAKWGKLQELKQMLNARLQDIFDRWAGGKGPLAVEFTPNELKQLVRALFQNTDRRSAVLSKIQ